MNRRCGGLVAESTASLREDPCCCAAAELLARGGELYMICSARFVSGNAPAAPVSTTSGGDGSNTASSAAAESSAGVFDDCDWSAGAVDNCDWSAGATEDSDWSAGSSSTRVPNAVPRPSSVSVLRRFLGGTDASQERERTATGGAAVSTVAATLAVSSELVDNNCAPEVLAASLPDLPTAGAALA